MWGGGGEEKKGGGGTDSISEKEEEGARQQVEAALRKHWGHLKIRRSKKRGGGRNHFCVQQPKGKGGGGLGEAGPNRPWRKKSTEMRGPKPVQRREGGGTGFCPPCQKKKKQDRACGIDPGIPGEKRKGKKKMALSPLGGGGKKIEVVEAAHRENTGTKGEIKEGGGGRGGGGENRCANGF